MAVSDIIGAKRVHEPVDAPGDASRPLGVQLEPSSDVIFMATRESFFAAGEWMALFELRGMQSFELDDGSWLCSTLSRLRDVLLTTLHRSGRGKEAFEIWKVSG